MAEKGLGHLNLWVNMRKNLCLAFFCHTLTFKLFLIFNTYARIFLCKGPKICPLASKCQNMPYFWGWLSFCKAKHTKVVLYHIFRKATVSVWHGYRHPPYDQTAIRTFTLEGCISCLAYYPCMTPINWIIFVKSGKIIPWALKPFFMYLLMSNEGGM